MAGTPVELIKEKLDIVEFLKGYLTLSPAGRNFKGLCPFHKEKSPSFMVSPDRQTWHCFGCGLGGDVFAFLMRYENLEFADALKALADKAGIELRRASPMEYKYFGVLYDLNASARDFFREQLEGSEAAKKYLDSRGLGKETIETFEIGFAPNGTDELTLYLVKKGFVSEDATRAGLSFRTDRGMYHDRFRGRIMFPIHNHVGKVVGFTGRILPQFDTGDMGKYVNSPETPIFQKSKLLYGLWKSKNPIREANAALLVEGQMDFLGLWQAGVRNVIATSGTALTAEHLAALRRQTEELLLSFDNDEAGQAALDRAIDLAEANDFRARVVVFPKEFKDPADAAQKDPDAAVKTLAAAIPAQEFYFSRFLPHALVEKQDGAFFKNLKIVLGKLKAMSSPAERSVWIGKLSTRVSIPEPALAEEMEKIQLKQEFVSAGKTEESPTELKPQSRWELISAELVALALQKNDWKIVDENFPYLAPRAKEAFAILKSGDKRSPQAATDALVNTIVLASAGEFEKDAAEDLSFQLKHEYVRERRQALTNSIRKAEAEGDDALLGRLMDEFLGLPTV